MNQFSLWYRTLPPAIRLLLTINVGAYVLFRLLVLFRVGPAIYFVEEYLALHPFWQEALVAPWQLITYNFLHLGEGLGGLLHILFNMLFLYWIGREQEETLGSSWLMAVYLITGIGGGLLSVGLFPLWPARIIHGASASVFGVITATAIRYPQKTIGLLFIGNVRLIYLVIGFIVLDLLIGGPVAVAAHLGGAIFGWLFSTIELRGVDLHSWARFLVPAGVPAYGYGYARGSGGASGLRAWWGKRAEAPPKKKDARPRADADEVEEVSQVEVDRILEKISAHGYEKLTEREKRILYEYSRR